MRRLAVLVGAVAALVVAPAAGAKELRAVVVCGSSGCVRVDDAETLRAVPQGGEAEEPLGPPAAFYRVTFVHGVPPSSGTQDLYYLPAQNALAYVDPYGSVRASPIFGPSATGTMKRLVRELRPFAPPRISAVVVGDRTLRGRDAATYAQLFRAGRSAPPAYPDEWIPVDLRSARPTPWTEGAREFMLAPEARLLERGGVQYELPSGLAADVAAARPLRDGDERFDRRAAYLLALLVPALLVSLALVRLRQGARPAATPAHARR